MRYRQTDPGYLACRQPRASVANWLIVNADRIQRAPDWPGAD